MELNSECVGHSVTTETQQTSGGVHARPLLKLPSLGAEL